MKHSLAYRVGYGVGYVGTLLAIGFAAGSAGIALATCLSGCCPAEDLSSPLYFDEEWTDHELSVLLDAMGEWSIATDHPLGPVHYDYPHGLNWLSWSGAVDGSVVHRMTEQEATLFRLAYPRFGGLASPGGSIAIAIEKMGSDWELRHVMLHELGHHYGHCGHADAPSLMVGSAGLDLDCIDAATLEVVCEAQGVCGPEAGSSCDESLP